jgi:hypothetical protein
MSLTGLHLERIKETRKPTFRRNREVYNPTPSLMINLVINPILCRRTSSAEVPCPAKTRLKARQQQM